MNDDSYCLDDIKIISKTSWNAEVVIITVVGLSIVLGCLILLFINEAVSVYLKWVLGTVIILPILYVATWTPISLSISKEKIVLKQLLGHIAIPLDDVILIQKIDTAILDHSIRAFGSGGAFGYLGNFWNKTLVKYSMYITDRKNLLLVKTHHKTYVFNCNNPEHFESFFLANR